MKTRRSLNHDSNNNTEVKNSINESRGHNNTNDISISNNNSNNSINIENNNSNSDSGSCNNFKKSNINNIENKINKNKRKSIDNGNNSRDNDEFNLKDMHKSKASKLGRSLGLITNYNNLEETKDKIKSTLNQKKKLDKENCESSNPFNVNYGELKIKDNIEPIEYLFFRVFRNKYIFKQIISNMDKLSTIAYESIMSINKMIKRDQISMLKDKVYRKQTLTNLDNLEEFFKYFKNDKTFIQLFFNNYRNDIYGMVLCMEDVAKQAIYSDCKAALELLVEEYQFEPSLNFFQKLLKIKFYKSSPYNIKKKKFKFIKYILENSDIDLKQDINNIIPIDSSFSPKVIKLLEYLFNRSIVDQNSVVRIIKSLFQVSMDPPNFKLKYLFLINRLVNNNSSENSSGNNISIYIQDFSQVELNSYCHQLFNFSIEKRQVIKNLINEIYTLREDKCKSLTYYSAFGDEDEELNISTSRIENGDCFKFKSFLRSQNYVSAEFGNFRVFIEYLKKNNSIHPHILSKCSKEFNNKLFKNIGNQEYDREKKRKFLIELAHFIKNAISEYGNIKIHLDFLIVLDDLELLQLFIQEIGEFNNFSFSLFSIKSIQVLDYLFQVLPFLFIHNQNMVAWKDIKDTILLGRLEELVSKKSLKLCPLKYPINDLNDQIIQYILERPEIYQIIELSSHLNYEEFNYSEDRFKLLLKFVYQDYRENINIISKYLFSGPVMNAKLIHHLLNSFEFSNISIPKYFKYYFSNNYDEAIQDYIFSKYSYLYDSLYGKFIRFVVQKQDFIFLNSFFKEILSSIRHNKLDEIQKQSMKKIIEHLIEHSCENGYFKVVEFIHLNFPSILNASARNNERIFTIDELRNFLYKSRHDFKILMYLLNIIKITKKQYISHCRRNPEIIYFNLLFNKNILK